MIVDCHVHLNNYAAKPVPTEENLEALLLRMRRYGIDHAIVLTSYIVNEDRPRVDRVLNLVRDHPEISVVEGVTFRNGKPHDLAGMRKRLESKRIVGLKMYPGYLPFYPHDRACEPVYELAQDFDVPVMFHAGDTYAKGAKVKFSHPLHLDEVAVDHPDLKIVLCHLGNPWFRDTAEVLYKNDNVWADISGLVLERFDSNIERWLAEEVREIIAYAGDPEYLLYGTDWPLVRMRPYLGFIDSLGLDEKDRDRILWKNSKKLFKLDLRKRRPAKGSKEPIPPAKSSKMRPPRRAH